MKKKLLLCMALLGFMQFASAEKPLDVSETYLKNYKAPFAATGEALIPGTVKAADGITDISRFQKLAGSWVTAGDLGTMGTDYTTWHVDFQKKPNYPTVDNTRKGVLTLTSGWDGFYASFDNMKVYQTVTLPAGKYELKAKRAQDWSGAKWAFLAVAAGTTIPDTANLSTALDSVRFDKAKEVTVGTNKEYVLSTSFTLTQPTEISYGLVASFNETVKAKVCVSISEFQLIQWVEGTNYTALKALVKEAKTYTTTQYPIGITMGTYPQAKWDALQAAIATAEAFIAQGENDTQENVDAQVTALQTAVNDLNGSMILPFKVSDDTKTYWYQIRDMRDPNSYWEIGAYSWTSEDGLTSVSYPAALIMNQAGDNTSDFQLFKITKAPSPSKGYNIYSKLDENTPLSASLKANKVQLNGDSIAATWQFGKTADAAHFTVFVEGSISNQLNSYVGSTPQFIGFYYPGAGVQDPGNSWEFVEVVEAGQTDFNALKALTAKAVAMTETLYPVGTAELQYPAEAWNAFVAARTAALALVAKEGSTPQETQETVDAMVVSLQTAIDNLKAAQNPPFVVSNETTTAWYQLHDRRSPKSYWMVGAYDEASPNNLIMTTTPDATSDAQLFKLMKAPEPSTGYYIYNKLNEATSLSVMDGFIKVDAALAPTAFLYSQSPVASHFIIQTEDTQQQLNSFAGYTPQYIGLYNNVNDIGNQWQFVRVTLSAVKNVTASDLGVSVRGRKIVCTDASAKLNVFSVLGQKVNVKAELSRGIYLVQVEGKQGTVKLFVK